MNNKITPRKFNMPEPLELPLYWYQTDPLLTSFFTALSTILPDGEKFMIDTLREARDHVQNAELKIDITGFIGQEAHHSLAHSIVNKTGLDHQIDIPAMEKDFRERVLKSLYQGSLAERLAFGAAIEHFTAIFGEYVLSNPDSLTNMPEVMHAFILWHAIEELEHKSVVFDAFLEVSKGNLALRRRAFMKAFRVLMSCVLEYQKQFLKQANYQPTWSIRRDAFRYFFGLNGLFSSNMRMVFDYLKADFHPTQHQQAHFIVDWQNRYPVVVKYLS